MAVSEFIPDDSTRLSSLGCHSNRLKNSLCATSPSSSDPWVAPLFHFEECKEDMYFASTGLEFGRTRQVGVEKAALQFVVE